MNTMESEKSHLIIFNSQLQKDILQYVETAKITRDSLEYKLQLKIHNLEENVIKYAEVLMNRSFK